ncbi:MAG: hypothetical protein CMI01_04275 [Oceanospirillaceae bacterium]|nr:hypothetical protein [Oceanospirillaceae bacterium]
MDAMQHYFEPASRTQLASKLCHLLRFSDLLLLLVGNDGSGRTTVLNAVAEADHEERGRRRAWLKLDATADVTGLLRMLVDQLGVDCPADADNRTRLSAVHELSRTLHESGIALQLLVDDADFLTNNALELLVSFSRLEEAAPRVVLTGSPEFEQRFLANEFDQMLDGRLHVQHLEPFEPDEAEAFIDDQLPAGTHITKRQRRRLLDGADGYPGRLHRGLIALTREGGIKRRSGRAFPLSGAQMSVIVVVLVSIFGASLWLYLPESSPDEAEATRVSLPLDIPVPATAAEPEVVSVREELSQRLAEQEKQLIDSAGSGDESAGEESVQNGIGPEGQGSAEPLSQPAETGPAESTERSQPEVLANVEPEPVAESPDRSESEGERPPGSPVKGSGDQNGGSQGEPVPAEVATAPEEKVEQSTPEPSPAQKNDEPEREESADTEVTKSPAVHALLRADELLEWPDQGYTLQMLGARSVASVEKFIGAQDNPERFYYFRTVYKEAPWHVVVYGQYATREAAMNAVAALPASLRKLRPWARSIAGVKSDIRK